MADKRILTIDSLPELPYAVEEAVNRLRVNISFLGKDIKKIMVISTMPDEGKSFVALQLWRQLAEGGVDSILVDADMRKSVILEKYGVKAADGKEILGFSHYLANDVNLSDYIYGTQFEHGDIIPNHDNVINPSLLLETDRFKDTLDELGKQYRYVFIDSPPLNLVSDGERIGSLCDGAILVVRGGETPKSMVRNSIAQLERAGCPLLGIVLNRVKGAGSGYYSKKYGSAYGYYGKKYGYYGKNGYGYYTDNKQK